MIGVAGRVEGSRFGRSMFDTGGRLTTFTKLVLYTDRDGRAKFREEQIPLDAGTPQMMLSAILASDGFQFRHSPVGFRSQFHCTPRPQWVFVLQGQMEIGLQDGSSRVLQPGNH